MIIIFYITILSFPNDLKYRGIVFNLVLKIHIFHFQIRHSVFVLITGLVSEIIAIISLKKKMIGIQVEATVPLNMLT